MGSVQAQDDTRDPLVQATTWQHCATLTQDREARLSCFDRWATQQTRSASSSAVGNPLSVSATTALRPPVPASAPPPLTINITTPPAHDCRSPEYSEISRFWELEAGSDCGTFSIRGYRPIGLSWIGSDSVNAQPASPSTSGAPC